MPSVGFKPIISAGERPQTYALDRAATGTGKLIVQYLIYRIVHLLALIVSKFVKMSFGFKFSENMSPYS
jgi:hypothetical protein